MANENVFCSGPLIADAKLVQIQIVVPLRRAGKKCELRFQAWLNLYIILTLVSILLQTQFILFHLDCKNCRAFYKLFTRPITLFSLMQIVTTPGSRQTQWIYRQSGYIVCKSFSQSSASYKGQIRDETTVKQTEQYYKQFESFRSYLFKKFFSVSGLYYSTTSPTRVENHQENYVLSINAYVLWNSFEM